MRDYDTYPNNEYFKLRYSLGLNAMRYRPVCEERKGRKGKDSEERTAMKVVDLG